MNQSMKLFFLGMLVFHLQSANSADYYFKPKFTIAGEWIIVEAETNLPNGTKIMGSAVREMKIKGDQEIRVPSVGYFYPREGKPEKGIVVVKAGFLKGKFKMWTTNSSQAMKFSFSNATWINTKEVNLDFTVSEAYKNQPKSIRWPIPSKDSILGIKTMHFENKFKYEFR